VWYPAADVTGRTRAPYFSDAETKSTARSLGALVGAPFFFTYSRHVMTNSFIDAPLARNVTNLPAVFYSHGYTSFLGQNTVLMEHLASHGYVVFSVQHTYDSAATAFPNGDVIPMDPGMMSTVAGAEAGRPLMVAAMGGATLDARLEGAVAHQEFTVKRNERIATASTRAWVADRMFVHDALQNAPPAAVADIAAASRLDRVGEVGMSFGGAVSGEVCMIDPRCAAGINLDGGNYPFSAFNADVPAPFLMFHSDLKNIYRQLETPVPEGSPPRGYNEFSYERLATAGTRPDVYRMQLKDAQHLGLSDSSLFLTSPLKDPLFGSTPTNILINAQNDFVLGFLDKHLRNMANDFPVTEMASYKDWILPASNADIREWWSAKPEAVRAAFEARIAAVKQRYGTQAPILP
jgi:predicted dienelactone hydrolase